jgi:hypothetical protein
MNGFERTVSEGVEASGLKVGLVRAVKPEPTTLTLLFRKSEAK